ncbi:MAG: tetratricopeptide repeat protein, partial [Polyangiaceae bacterium]|nr:tetratricopeptide repeat protein [Polyangiaceae bacterium]
AKLDEDTFAMLVSNLREARPDSVVARLLAVECAVGFGTPEKLVDELAAWGGEAAIGETDRVRGLAAGLVAELLSMRERAHDEYARAHAADPTCEAALRATCAFDPDSCSTRLVELASTLGSGSKAAILALEAALWAGPVADGQYEALVRQCAELDPSLPFANFLGERFARMRGDSDAVLEWVRARREASADPIEASHDRCREAMLMVERDVSVAASLLADASAARPQDIALRSLYERFAPERPDDCLAWRAERVRDTEGPDKARMLLAIATAYERQGMADDAAKMAHLAVEHGAGELAQRCLERCELAGAAISSLTDSLMQVARADHVSAEQRREARERLAELDEKGRNDQASALLWHRAILEETPDYLPSLRRLEHAFVSEGRDEDLEPIASDLTRLLEGPEVDAHAVVAARVRLRDQAWTQLRGLADLAASQRNPSLWSLRQAFNQARAAGDDNALVLLATQLAASADDEGEGATMLVRAAEALARKGQRAEAAELLQAAMKQEPRLAHAHLTLIDVLEASGEYARAAEQIEALARKSVVPSHQVQLWHRAARLWLDKAADLQRGRMALEEACGIDVAYGTVFDDLRAIYAAAEDTTQLAALLERRLNAIVDPNERVEMEVLRAKALAAVGEVTGAKAALAAALDACPDHLLALDAFANVAWNDQDWSGAEQALIRLGRLVTDTEQQIGIYRKLSQIYLNHLPDYERAELALREVLKRNPSDVDAQGRLVDVFRETGNATKGIELCNALLEQAKTQEEKRKHTIQLALIHEQAEGDVPKAKGVLERVYKQAPTWAPSLGALARFYQRHGEEGALNVLLERSANDARRALRTGRFNRDLFSVLETVAALRSNEAMQLVARAAVAAIEGENMLLLPAAGPAALSVDLDDVIAPELLTAPLRALLKRAGHVLDAAFPMDLQALRAGDLPPSVGDLAASVSRVADTTGLTSFSAFVSPALGPTCVPVSSSPAVIIIGASLLSSHDELVRDFLILRALKIVQTRGCVLSRTAPIDLLPVVAAFIKGLAPSYVPSGVDPRRFDDAFERISAVRGASVEPDVAALALELGAGLDNRASTLNVAVNGWGDRAALLAQGSLESALNGIAWAGGHPSGPPSSGRDRMTWIGRNAEARELIVFLASDEYGEARSRLGG